MQRIFLPWLFVVAWMALIFYLSAQPASESTQLSGGLMEPIFEVVETVVPEVEAHKETFHTLVRKSAHFFAYFILGILAFRAFRVSQLPMKKSAIYAFLVTVGYAITDEVHQLFVPGRSGEIRDVLIDSAGGMIGITLYVWVISVYKKKKAASNV